MYFFDGDAYYYHYSFLEWNMVCCKSAWVWFWPSRSLALIDDTILIKIALYLFMSSQVLGPKEHEQAERNEYNFDHPDAFDFDLLIKTLRRLKDGKKVEVPIYNFVTHSREKQSVNIFKWKALLDIL